MIESQIISYLVGILVALLAWIFNKSLSKVEKGLESHEARLQQVEKVDVRVLLELENVNKYLAQLSKDVRSIINTRSVGGLGDAERGR